MIAIEDNVDRRKKGSVCVLPADQFIWSTERIEEVMNWNALE